MKAKELEFIPVILGGDITTYSLARSFHEEYGIKSIAISTVKNWLNSYSSIIDNIIEPKMNDLDTFLKRLTSLGQQYLGKKKLILIACGDWYVRMVIYVKRLRRFSVIFFLLVMFAELYSLILAIAEQIREASYYVMLISSLGSLAARLTG